MIDVSVGAIGAAIVAGLVSLLGLVIGKEQKVSEFRQAWINELRICLVNYLASINAVCDAIRVQKIDGKQPDQSLVVQYKLLNEASNGIKLRLNKEENTSRKLLKNMKDFEQLASSNSNLTPDNIQRLEKDFIKASSNLLKFEWQRVKRGEPVYVWTKSIVTVCIIFLGLLLIYLQVFAPLAKGEKLGDGATKKETTEAAGAAARNNHSNRKQTP